MMNEKIQIYRCLADFLPRPDSRRLVILTGARQTGKTTLAKISYPGLKYINLDAPENRQIVKGALSANWARDIGEAVIDESQKEPVVFEKVKYAYDEGAVTFSVMLGSSQILLLKKIRESLAGRAALYELWPLLMSELAAGSAAQEIKPPLLDRLLEDDVARILEGTAGVLLDQEDCRLRNAESHLLQWGGMPALLPLSTEERWKWLKDYEYTYLERDLEDLARLSDLEPFRKFQKLSALRSARLLSYSELARDAAVSVDTARRYLEYLRLSYQVILLPPYYKNITSSVVKAPKLYWLDIGLLRQLSGYKGELNGEIYETMVVAEVVKWFKTAQRESEAYFYRTRSGLELDLLLCSQDKFLGIEIKGRAKIAPADIRPLKEVAKGLSNRWRGGLVVYLGNEIKKIAEPNIWLMPSRRLLAY